MLFNGESPDPGPPFCVVNSLSISPGQLILKGLLN